MALVVNPRVLPFCGTSFQAEGEGKMRAYNQLSRGMLSGKASGDAHCTLGVAGDANAGGLVLLPLRAEAEARRGTTVLTGSSAGSGGCVPGGG